MTTETSSNPANGIGDAGVACPRHAVRTVVIYHDNHHREQVGEVLDIQATWHRWGDGSPLIIYRVRHPSYRNRHAYVDERNILGPPTPPEAS